MVQLLMSSGALDVARYFYVVTLRTCATHVTATATYLDINGDSQQGRMSNGDYMNFVLECKVERTPGAIAVSGNAKSLYAAGLQGSQDLANKRLGSRRTVSDQPWLKIEGRARVQSFGWNGVLKQRGHNNFEAVTSEIVCQNLGGGNRPVKEACCA